MHLALIAIHDTLSLYKVQSNLFDFLQSQKRSLLFSDLNFSLETRRKPLNIHHSLTQSLLSPGRSGVETRTIPNSQCLSLLSTPCPLLVFCIIRLRPCRLRHGLALLIWAFGRTTVADFEEVSKLRARAKSLRGDSVLMWNWVRSESGWKNFFFFIFKGNKRFISLNPDRLHIFNSISLPSTQISCLCRV